MEPQKNLNRQSNFVQEEQRWKLHILWFQNIFKAAVFETVWYCHKNCHIKQWNRIEGPEINPHIYSQLTFERVLRTQNGEISSISGFGKTECPHEIGTLSHHMQKWTQDRLKT